MTRGVAVAAATASAALFAQAPAASAAPAPRVDNPVAGPACANLRVVTVDSLPNLVTNTSGRPTAIPACDRVKQNGTYVRGIGYAPAELSFAQAFRQRLVRAGFSAGVGMLIGTSRNGWGGSARPAGPGPRPSVDEHVDRGRVDRRVHAGDWCNQPGAGLGERPAAPASGIDAFVWMKPPGESDGASREVPNDDGKGFDRMCDPAYGATRSTATTRPARWRAPRCPGTGSPPISRSWCATRTHRCDPAPRE